MAFSESLRHLGRSIGHLTERPTSARQIQHPLRERLHQAEATAIDLLLPAAAGSVIVKFFLDNPQKPPFLP